MINRILYDRAKQYAQRMGLELGGPLGSGAQGSVWTATSKSNPDPYAVKAHHSEPIYQREKSIYLRLFEKQITTIRGCNVPQLIDFNDELLILEMEIVQRPFVLDFGGAYLDNPPDYSPEVIADWETEKREQYGDTWPEVQAILRELTRYGIFMIDVHPGNISFTPG
ncbi:MAG: hypothetical protein ACRCZF_22460 [Gemmataceae bacterium]